MKALLIVLGCLAAVTIVLCVSKLTVCLGYDESFYIRIRLGLVKLFDSETAGKKSAKKDAASKDGSNATDGDGAGKKSKRRGKSAKAKKKLTGRGLLNILSLIRGVFDRMRIRLRISRMYAFVRLGLEDAAATALDYGRLSAALYALYGVLNARWGVDECEIELIPDFDRQVFEARGQICIFGRGGNILLALLRLLVYFIGNRKTIRESFK